MSNKKIFEEILSLYGKEPAILFCRMEGQKCRMQLQDLKERNIDPVDLEYDAEWWENKYNELLNN